jgi:hypothetical protein
MTAQWQRDDSAESREPMDKDHARRQRATTHHNLRRMNA